MEWHGLTANDALGVVELSTRADPGVMQSSPFMRRGLLDVLPDRPETGASFDDVCWGLVHGLFRENDTFCFFD